MHEPDRPFLFLLGSARREGNSELLARRAAEALPADVAQSWRRLTELPLPDFVDGRHGPAEGEVSQWPAEPSGNEASLLADTLAATDVVIVSPVYWYSLSAQVKRYLDHWTSWMVLPEVRLRRRMGGRTLWLITALSDPAEQAEPTIGSVRRTAEYMHLNWGGVLLGVGDKPGDVLAEPSTLDQADSFFVTAMADRIGA